MKIKLMLGLCIIAMLSNGCSTVGNGKQTLVKRCVNGQDIQNVFPEFTSHQDANCRDHQLIALTPDAPTDLKDFNLYLKEQYNLSPGQNADSLVSLNALVRNKSATPPLLSDAAYTLIQDSIKEVELNKDLSNNVKDILIRRLKAKLLNRPRIETTTTKSGSYEGADLYDYFPRVEIDFSAQLHSTKEWDSFKYLGIVLKLSDEKYEGRTAKFIDFKPKEADIVEFSRGQLVEDAELSVANETSDTVKEVINKATTQTTPEQTEATPDTKDSFKSFKPSITYTDTFTNQLVGAIERRTTGILDNGKTFFAVYKSTKNKRISGSYEYDLMMEVPSKASFKYSDGKSEVGKNCEHAKINLENKNKLQYIISEPCEKEVTADIYLLGVARHVYHRGMTGFFTRVPEVENDDVYEQVVVKKISDVKLWKNDQDAWLSRVTKKLDQTLTIYSNLDDAQFSIFLCDKGYKNCQLNTVGKGKEFKFDYEKPKNREIKLLVKFHDVLHQTDIKNITYIANDVKVGNAKIIFGTYRIR